MFGRKKAKSQAKSVEQNNASAKSTSAKTTSKASSKKTTGSCSGKKSSSAKACN